VYHITNDTGYNIIEIKTEIEIEQLIRDDIVVVEIGD
jgi:hypothetical protein